MSDSERIEKLTSLVASLREQLSLAEARVAQLTAVVSESAEDLQPFGDNWFRPSAVVSVTANQSGIMLNGSPIGMGSQGSFYSPQMAEIAARINQANAKKRQQAGLPEPESQP